MRRGAIGLGCVLGCVLAAGCGAARPTTSAQTPAADARASAARPTAASSSTSAQPAQDPRRLPAYPTFADLVDAARALDDAMQTHSAAGCLLRGEHTLRLEADLSAGVRPLPRAPAELASTLDKTAGPIAVLSTWGLSAGENPELGLVAFSTTTTNAVDRPSLAVLFTSKGVYVRGADLVSRAHPQAMPLTAAVSLLSQPGLANVATLYVSAEASVPLTQVRELLHAIGPRYEVVLAVALPKGTHLPDLATHTNDFLCPTGLSELAADATEGELPGTVLQTTLAPLREAALACALSTAGRAARGGKLQLDLRIGPDGSATELCLEHDDIGEPALRHCVIESARSLKFPRPDPAGFVDVSLPLALSLQGPTAQRALCE